MDPAPLSQYLGPSRIQGNKVGGFLHLLVRYGCARTIRGPPVRFGISIQPSVWELRYHYTANIVSRNLIRKDGGDNRQWKAGHGSENFNNGCQRRSAACFCR